MPFDKLPEDVQNQILPMLGLQPSEELKHDATINAVGKLSQAADHASNLLSAAEQPDAPQHKASGDRGRRMMEFSDLDRTCWDEFKASFGLSGRCWRNSAS